MNSLLSDVLQVLINNNSVWEPLCDLSEVKNKLFLELEAPNLDINSLSVNIINSLRVEISGTRKRHEQQEAVYLLAERVFGKFRKTIELPYPVSGVEQIEYTNGIVKITLNKE